MKTDTIKDEYFDAAVIGGGAAGMMAALSASRNGAKVVLIEKNHILGKKLLLTGNGRCNITQAHYDTRELIEKLGRNGKFLFPTLSIFGPMETIELFENLGLKVKIEKDGRVFPVSNKAEEVLDVLIKALVKNKVRIELGQKVLGIKMKDRNMECVETENRKIYAKNFILSTGGKSYPATGSTGEGYSWLARIGHSIIPPTPALVPIRITESWVRDLQGISLKNVSMDLVQNDRKFSAVSGEIIFTHFGLSGPAVINASKIIGQHLKESKVFLKIDLFPALNLAGLEEKLKHDFETCKKKNLKTYLSGIFPQKLVVKLMELAGIEKERKIYSLTKLERNNLARLMKNIHVNVDSLLDFKHAMITSGGVNLKEVDPKTMRSKIVPNLFLAGEVLDLDGPTGGYNLQIAWTTGHTAGRCATT